MQTNQQKRKDRLISATVVNGKTQDECYKKILDTVKTEYFWCINSDADLLDESITIYDLFRRNRACLAKT